MDMALLLFAAMIIGLFILLAFVLRVCHVRLVWALPIALAGAILLSIGITYLFLSNLVVG